MSVQTSPISLISRDGARSPVGTLAATFAGAADTAATADPGDTGASDLRAQWLQLLARDRRATVHLHPNLATNAESLGGHEPCVYSRWSADDERTLASLAVAPITRKPFRMLPGLTKRLRGQWLVGGRVLGADDQTECREFLRWSIAQMNGGRGDFMLLEDIAIGEPLWEAAQALRTTREITVLEHLRREPRWWIDFPAGTPKNYWDKFSKKTASNFRRRARKFEHKLVRYDRADQIDEFLKQAHDVTTKSWQWIQLRRGVHNDDRERRFLRLLAEHDAMRCYMLTSKDGQPIAFLLGYQWNGCYVYDKPGFDPAFTNESPGTVLLVKLIDDLIDHRPPRTLDFGPGLHEYKETFGNRQTLNGSLLLVRKAMRPGIVARLDRWNYVARNAANRMAHRALAVSGLLPLVRRMRKKSLKANHDS